MVISRHFYGVKPDDSTRANTGDSGKELPSEKPLQERVEIFCCSSWSEGIEGEKRTEKVSDSSETW